MKFYIKTASQDVHQEVELDESQTIGDLKQYVKDLWGWNEMHVVYAGTIIRNPAATLVQAGVTPESSIYVVPNRQRPAAETTANDQQEVRGQGNLRYRVPNLSSSEPQGDPRSEVPQREQSVCRICFSSHSTPDGPTRMISPCMCRGSVGKVHVECLNEWRVSSTNSRSYYVCEQCGYEYNLARTQIAELLRSERSVRSVVLIIVVSAVLLSGIIATHLGLERYFYDFIQWQPFWYYNTRSLEKYWLGWLSEHLISARPVLDTLISGGLAVGMTAAAVYKYQELIILHEIQDHLGVALLCASIFGEDTRVWRVFALYGLVYAYRALLASLLIHSKRLMRMAGEMVVDISTSEQVMGHEHDQ